MQIFNLINHNQFLNVLRLAITVLLASSSNLLADCGEGSSSGPKKEVFPILASFGEWNVSKDPSDGACWASSKPLNTSTLQPFNPIKRVSCAECLTSAPMVPNSVIC
jgi:hypothetical protein